MAFQTETSHIVHTPFSLQDQTQNSKACFTDASPFTNTVQRILLTSRCTSATIFSIKIFQSSWKCLTSLPLPTSLILLRKLYYVVSEIANLVEKQWGWKLVCASSLQCLTDYLQMGSGWSSQPEQISPGMPCIWLNLRMPPNLHLCGFKSAYQPWCQQVSSFGLKLNWETCRRLSCHMQWMNDVPEFKV